MTIKLTTPLTAVRYPELAMSFELQAQCQAYVQNSTFTTIVEQIDNKGRSI
jgi:hypothetical protein